MNVFRKSLAMCAATVVVLGPISGLALPAVNEEVVVSTPDKSGKKYSLIRRHIFNKGISTTEYVLHPEGDVTQEVTVYSGSEDGEGGGCNRREQLKLERAHIRDRLVVKDLNGDGWNDIGVRIRESECKVNGKGFNITKDLIATDDGFKIKEQVQEN